MHILYNDKKYDVLIEKKKRQKNTYIRVDKNLNIKVTTGYLTPSIYIKKLLIDKHKTICKMIDNMETKISNNNGFFYLGNKYTIIYKDQKGVEFVGDKVFVGHNFDPDKWYKKEAKKLFLERLDYNYNNFSRNIPYPSLRIRKMTTRWGVCNVSRRVITLNLELIKRDIKYLDYVIIHELSHLIYGGHDKKFWALVEENMPDYKKYKKEMRDF